MSGQSLATTLHEKESDYLWLNQDAVHDEARAEADALQRRGCEVTTFASGNRVMVGIFPPEDRPFRLYRGCIIMLRGKDIFNPRDARNFPARNIWGKECE
jgi:hypothetical protein